MLRVVRVLSKVSFECAVACFGTSQLERATRFLTFKFENCLICPNIEGFIQCLISAKSWDVGPMSE